MGTKMFAFVGNWRSKDQENGLSVCEYDQKTGKLNEYERHFRNVSVGNTAWDQSRKILYFVDEQVVRPGKQVYGGGVLAAAFSEESGKMQLISEVDSLSTNPSYVCVDKSGEYLLVTHHVSRNCVAQIVRNEDGSYNVNKKYDDVTLTLYRLEQDGRIGEICDMYIVLQEDERCPHLHSLYVDPTGDLYISCDKGLDKIYSFRINREDGKLVLLDTAQTAFDTWPRYGVFHPEKPYFYTNCENSTLLYAWQYDIRTGKLTNLQSLDMYAEEPKERAMPSDITISPDGRYIYVSIRGTNHIAVLKVMEDGMLEPIQMIPCEGKNPRGIVISPKGDKLLSANLDSGNIAVFHIEENGKLAFSERKSEMHAPGNILFI